MSKDNILEVTNVTMKFNGLVALNEVSFQLERGSILGLIGPNGAGKTTLFNTITGYYQNYTGEVSYNKTRLSGKKAHERCQMGIARTFQITRPFENNTILQNVMVGAYYGTAPNKHKTLAECSKKALALLEYVGLDGRKDELAGNLNVAQRKKLELARALSTEPQLLLLDEVVGGLNPTEVTEMMEMIKNINSTGVSVLMIEHVMKAVMGVSHHIIVLNHGEKLAEGEPQEIIQNPEVVSAYLGSGRRAKHA